MTVMEFSENLIAISDIRQHIFCPRIPWYSRVMNFKPPEQGWVTQGRHWHAEQKTRHKRRVCNYLFGELTHNQEVYVQSTKLGIHGYVDEIINNSKQSVVIEYKVDSSKPTLAQKLQLAAYAIAAQEYLNFEVVAAVLFKGNANKQYQITLDEKLKIQLFQVIREIKTNLNCQRLPFSNASEAKCEQCEYLRYCNDR